MVIFVLWTLLRGWISILVRNNLWDWQSLQVTSGAGSQFYRFCDALEYRNGVKAPASGWGVEYAFAAWGKYWRTIYLSGYVISFLLPFVVLSKYRRFILSMWCKWRGVRYTVLHADPSQFNSRTCLGTYDPTIPYWTDISVDNANRSWMWIL